MDVLVGLGIPVDQLAHRVEVIKASHEMGFHKADLGAAVGGQATVANQTAGPLEQARHRDVLIGNELSGD